MCPRYATQRRLCTVATLVAVFCCPVAYAQYGQDDQPPSPLGEYLDSIRPRYDQDRRYLERWEVLYGLDPNETGDFWDPIKYISLSNDDSIWVSFGGDARFRLESWNNYRFDPPNDDVSTFWRMRFHSDLHVGDQVRFFVEGKSSHATNRSLPGGRRTLDVDDLDLQQGFGDFMFPLDEDAQLTLRVGRQELVFGKQRIVSPLDLSTTRRTWDGFSAILHTGGWNVTGFWTQFAPVQKYSFNDPDAGTQFYGIYASGRPEGLPVLLVLILAGA